MSSNAISNWVTFDTILSFLTYGIDILFLLSQSEVIMRNQYDEITSMYYKLISCYYANKLSKVN